MKGNSVLDWISVKRKVSVKQLHLMWTVHLANTASVYKKDPSSEMDLLKADKYERRDKLQKIYRLRSIGNFRFVTESVNVLD